MTEAFGDNQENWVSFTSWRAARQTSEDENNPDGIVREGFSYSITEEGVVKMLPDDLVPAQAYALSVSIEQR